MPAGLLQKENVVMPLPPHYSPGAMAPMISCDWPELKEQLLAQWTRLTPDDLDRIGPSRRRIAMLVERKYGISCDLVENYLRNFERTMPLATRQ